MGLWDNVGWLTVGAYNAVSSGQGERIQKQQVSQVEAIIQCLTDKAFEEKLKCEIADADGEKFNEIWCRIEEFKRDNPHLIQKHLASSYWFHVGKERFPFTYTQFLLQTGKQRLTKSDEKLLGTYRGWTLTLLMNTYGKYSTMEATRIAFRQVFGAGRDSWTREFG